VPTRHNADNCREVNDKRRIQGQTIKGIWLLGLRKIYIYWVIFNIGVMRLSKAIKVSEEDYRRLVEIDSVPGRAIRKILDGEVGGGIEVGYEVLKRDIWEMLAKANEELMSYIEYKRRVD